MAITGSVGYDLSPAGAEPDRPGAVVDDRHNPAVAIRIGHLHKTSVADIDSSL